MATYTADDFARADFARHPDGGLAMRVRPLDVRPWETEHCYASDATMALTGWVPVPHGSYTRHDSPDYADGLAAHMWKEAARRLAQQRNGARRYRDFITAAYDRATEQVIREQHRAEKAEKERDEARADRVLALRREKAEQDRADRAKRERDAAVDSALSAAAPRPLGPDAITKEDLSGVVRVVVVGPNGREYDRGDLYSNGARVVVQDYGHTVKVFPAPPPPPAWADLAAVFGDLDVSALVDTDDLARQAHEHGVRVTGAES